MINELSSFVIKKTISINTHLVLLRNISIIQLNCKLIFKN